ncbi:MAG: sigma-54 dependent transcriptional regulator [Sedimentisphaerales bacterium]|nr:sigma-54 dependent transcriptional regulator [Sedimentisphaerales bacterium]
MTERSAKESAQRNVENFNKTLINARALRGVGSVRMERLGSDKFIGTSAAFISIIETIAAIASRRCSVVITGETGTGKEMVARELHRNSDRADGVFIPVDCTTLTGQLFESQLFGHTKGSFTGAVDNTLGFFRAAHGGTIFLDEISELPLDLQAKLLRVLQENSVTPLGSTKSYLVDTRVLCATNRDLREMVRQGTFRADLYYRLNVVTVEIPPLRQRREDIMVLAEYFLRRQSQFYNEPAKMLSPDSKRLLTTYSWPGNIRELANAIERAYVLSPGREILPAALPMELLLTDISKRQQTGIPRLEDAKKQLVIEALRFTGYRKLAAAQLLGVERRSLNRMMHKFNLSIAQLKHATAKN